MKQIVDHMVANGYRDAGYEYVSIDVSFIFIFTRHLFLQISKPLNN